MKSKVLKIINEYNLIKQGENVSVALSGGADSVALLYVLLELDYNVKAIHINHGIRGKAADSDELFCKELCEKLSVPFKSFHLNLKEASEDEMRKLRYDIFKKEGLVATAHHIEDNTETFFINLIRGTGKTGLGGIPVKKDNIIRPLISCTRLEIEEYLKGKNQEFCVDLTNFNNEIVRNNLRINILPSLRKINPKLDNNILNTSKILFQENSQQEIISLLKLEFINRSIETNFEKLLSCYNLIKNKKGSIQVSKDYIFEANADGYEFTALNKYEPIKEVENISLQEDEIRISDNRVIVFKKLSANEIKLFTNSTLKEYKNCVDCDKIKGVLSIRHKKAGEHFKMLRRPDKSLKDIFNEEHVPPEKRNTIPIITEYDKPIWIYSLGITSKVCLDENTKNAVHIILKEE